MLSASASPRAACAARAPKAVQGRPSRQFRQRLIVSAAAAQDKASEGTSATAATATKWYACVANAKWMLNDVQNESFAEQLREKTRHYNETGQEMDFFLVCEPEWLEKQHPEECKKVGRPCVALIGTDYAFIKFMKVRLDRVLFVEVEGSLEEVTKCGAPVPAFDRLDEQGVWRAPYSPYAPGWWNVFMPGAIKE
eukprot:jgi/Ulvmu1/9167/UM005_0265.1